MVTLAIAIVSIYLAAFAILAILAAASVVTAVLFSPVKAIHYPLTHPPLHTLKRGVSLLLRFE